MKWTKKTVFFVCSISIPEMFFRQRLLFAETSFRKKSLGDMFDLNPAEIQKFLFHKDQTPSRVLKNETKMVLNHKNSTD
jgi:hypothetical protein